MIVTVSELRADLDRLLDHVLETGEPLVIERNGRTLRILADRCVRDLAALPKHPEFIIGDPDDLVHVDWSEAWKASR